MNNIYPYSSPIILTDDIFQKYGGDRGKIEADESYTAAYLLAEMAVWVELETFLLPTLVTGTQYFQFSNQPYKLEYTYVNSVSTIMFLDTKEYVYYTIDGTDNIHASLRNPTKGILDINTIIGNCACHHHGRLYPYQVQTVYTAGLPTGTANQPDIEMALVTYADIILNEMVGYGNESTGDIGVKSFDNQDYSEVRVALLRTSFGTSARAQFIKKLLNKYKVRRYVGL